MRKMLATLELVVVKGTAKLYVLRRGPYKVVVLLHPCWVILVLRLVQLLECA